MSQINGNKLQAYLQTVAAVTKDELGKIVHIYDDKAPTPNILCSFFLTRCTTQAVREDALISFICDKALHYVLKRSEILGKKPEDYRRLWDLARQAFNLTRNTGEAGELLLFILLEANGIIQVYSKMDIKTNGKMAFHGYDAVHIGGGKDIALYIGHSKMYADFSSALNSALQDIRNFTANRPQRDREIHLLSNHIDASKFGEYTEQIRSIVNPYEEHRENFAEVNAVFLGSEWKFLQDGIRQQPQPFDDLMSKAFEAMHSETASKIQDKVTSIGSIKGQRFVFYVLPFSDVSDFRKKFVDEMRP